MENPFNLSDDSAYLRWRELKLANYPARASDLIVEVRDLANPSEAERNALTSLCGKANMAIYVTHPNGACENHIRNELQAFSTALGLNRTEGHRSAAGDGIVAIEIAKDEGRKGYIPYSDRPLSWHTDGYYNAPENRIGAFLLHCVRDAEEGGENGLLDPEIAYIKMRDENPDFIAAFMHPEAMTIPANDEGGGKVRAQSTGPVFSVNSHTGALHMRYTARGRNIVWRDTAETLAATRFLAELLNEGDPIIFRHKLTPGQGLVCNNVLHSRTRFRSSLAHMEGAGRLIYRVRYLDELSGTRNIRNGEEHYGATE